MDGARGFVAHYDTGGGVDHFSDAAVVPEVNLCVALVVLFVRMARNGVVDGMGGHGLTSLPQTPT
jgi:hypothetical protein